MPRPERSVDPTEGPVARLAVGLRELRRCAGSPGYRELARRAHYSATTLAQAARGVSLPSLAVTLAYVRACGGDAAEWERRWRAAEAELNPQRLPDPDADVEVGRAPYVGLVAYKQEDAEWFCGRERVVAAVVEWVACQRFVAVVGMSGAGKSSVLRAGLVPEVTADGGRWSALVMTPGAYPLEECAVHLGGRLGIASGQLAAEFADHPRNLGLAIRQLMSRQSDDAELLLVVDQFEEIFTVCHDAVERDRFIAALLDAAHGADSRARVVVGLRADFYAHCAEHARLAAVLEDAQVLVGPMSTEELRQAITQPAVRAGLMVEKTLVATVVHDAAERPGALPFVSHALWETWKRRRGNGLFLADYLAAGGVSGAIALTADRVYSQLDERQQRVARGIFLRLTALGVGTEDTRRRIIRTEIDIDPVTTEVLDRLAAARLITLAEDTVEIAHEALIRDWPALREWLTTDRVTLLAHRRLTEAATEWDQHGRDEGYLYRGGMLAMWQHRKLDTLNALEHAFLNASTTRHDRDRAARQGVRGLLVGLGVILVVISALAALAVVQANQAIAQRELALSHQLTARARNQLQVDPGLALQLATEAMQVKPTAEAEAVLHEATEAAAALATVHGQPLYVAFSPDGRKVAIADDKGTVRVWGLT